jgi:hypothetical protein
LLLNVIVIRTDFKKIFNWLFYNRYYRFIIRLIRGLVKRVLPITLIEIFNWELGISKSI